MTQREGDTGAERYLASFGSFLRWLQKPGLGRVGGRSLQLHAGLPGLGGTRALGPSAAASPGTEQKDGLEREQRYLEPVL